MTARRSVAVVGGGIAGVSAAWALAADHDVVLLETESQLAEHTTGRSAAILSETSGHRVVCALARASRPFLESPPEGFTAHPLTAPRGLLWIGRLGDEDLVATIETVARSGVAPSARRVEPAEAQRLVPVLRPHAVAGGAFLEPDACTIDVAALVAGFARGATSRGAEIRRRAELVAATRRSTGGWEIETASGSLTADVIVNAAGAWADVVAARAGVAPLGLLPLRRTAFIVPAPDDVRDWPLTMDVAGRCYFEPEVGGLLVSPADEHASEPTDARPEEIDVAWGLEVLNETTTLNARSVRRAWAGLRTFTGDRIPAVGWDGRVEGFCWVVGQGGAGIKTAPAIAAAVAAVVGEGDWPEALAALGVTSADVDPVRLVA
jgi:D-arginine dehydrogenase